MQRVVDGGGPFIEHIQSLYLDYEPPAGLSQWSAMWDELAVAALIDPSIITGSETMWLDADISHGPKYGDTVVWRRPDRPPGFFLPHSGPGGVDQDKWASHWEPPAHLREATVQMTVDVELFEDLFVELMTNH